VELRLKNNSRADASRRKNSPSFKASAMIYIMADGRSVSQPSKEYYKTIEKGYEKFNFDKNILHKALKSSII